MPRKRKSSKVGLSSSGRIDWDDNYVNKLIYVLAQKRYHGRYIAEISGLTVSQVYSRCKFIGIRLRDSRDGRCEEGRADRRLYHAANISQRTRRQVLGSVDTP